MYTILVTNDNELIVSVKERVMHRSKLVDTMHFLVDPVYKDMDMTEFKAYIEYVLPVSKEYHSEKLVQSDELYKDMIEYVLPFDTALTKEPGEIEVQITFYKLELSPEGKTIQYVRKTSTTTVDIIPIAAWSDIIPDYALNAVDRAMLSLEGKIKEMDEIADTYNKFKADNIAINDDGSVQLKSMGEFIGDSIDVATVEKPDSEDEYEDGVIDITGKYDTVMI